MDEADTAFVADMMPKLAQRVIKLKTNAAFTPEMREAVRKEKLSPAGQLKEINRLVNRTVGLAKKGESAQSLTDIYNKIISPKLNKYGAEYLPYGAASEIGDELFDKIAEAYKAAKK